MSLSMLAGVLLLVACVSAQNNNFADYDYQDNYQNRPPPRANPRPAPAPSRSSFFSEPTTPRPTPVPILKQINRHNDDGSYTYGFEGADGSFKIETKLPSGEVMGKYGYIDDTGKLRTVEYGANRYGFQPSGEGITVAPPTLVDESTRKGPNGEPLEYEDEYSPAAQPPPRPKASPRPRPRPHPQQQPQYDSYVARPQPQSFGPPPQRASIPSAAPAPPRSAPSPVPYRPTFSNAAPVPPRAVVSGAAPSGPIFRPAPSSSFGPVSGPAPVREGHRAAPRGLLDDLERQYALPQGRSNPTHDITFGSYSSQTSF